MSKDSIDLLFGEFSPSAVVTNNPAVSIIEKATSRISTSPTAIASSISPLSQLAQSPGLLSTISIIRQINPSASEAEIHLAITHLLTIAQSETGMNWNAFNESGHFGLLQQSLANWQASAKTALSRASKTDGLAMIKAMAVKFGIPPEEVNHISAKFGATDSKFYQTIPIAGCVTTALESLNKQFTWDGHTWRPHNPLVSQSPRWQDLQAAVGDKLNDFHSGAQAILSTIHKNGNSWFLASKLRYPKTISMDSEVAQSIASAPIVMLLLKQLKSYGLTAPLKGDTAHIDELNTKQTGGWLEHRKDGSAHMGVDYHAPKGTPIYAPVDGEVTKSFYQDAGGNHVRFKTPDGFVYIFAHVRELVNAGPRTRGSIIAYTGDTGKVGGKYSYPAHFHLSVRAPKGHIDGREDAWGRRSATQAPFYNPNYAPISPITFLIKPVDEAT